MSATFRNIFLVQVVIVAVALLFFAETAKAYEVERIPQGDAVVGDFVVGPGKVDIGIGPGESRTIEMLVTNRMGQRRIFNLEIEDTAGSSDPETPVILLGSDRGKYSLRDYIHFDEASFELGHGERARVPVTISVPADAEPGGLYGSVLVTTTSLPVEGEVPEGVAGGTVIVARIGTLFFITVPGEVEHNGELTAFSTIPDGKKYFTAGPIDFQLLYRNDGSIHLNPYGEIRVTNLLGQEVGFREIEPWFALPDSTRFREVSWNRPYLFGYYTAEANINRGYDDIVDTMSVSFVVLPWNYIAGGAAVILLLIFLIRLITKNFEFKRRES